MGFGWDLSSPRENDGVLPRRLVNSTVVAAASGCATPCRKPAVTDRAVETRGENW